MKTLKLSDGDLALDGASYAMVSGAERVKQQLGLCLREPYGIDRFHPKWGSVLPDWIGRAIINKEGLSAEIKAELVRVIRNFTTAQDAAIEQRAISGLRPVVTPNEVIVGVDGISVEQQGTQIIAKVSLRTAGGRTVTISTAPGRTDGYSE